jgi:hypothetical protein
MPTVCSFNVVKRGFPMFVYARMTIDFWAGWLEEAEYKNQLPRRFYTPEDIKNALAKYESFLEKGKGLAAKVGWEGDMRDGPYVAGLPKPASGRDGQVMVAWKQDNNGDTFIVSPLRLPWLENDDNYGSWIEG